MEKKELKLQALLSIYSKVLDDIIAFQKEADNNPLQWMTVVIVPILAALNIDSNIITITCFIIPVIQMACFSTVTQYHTFVAMLRGYAAYLEDEINKLLEDNICLYNSRYIDRYIASIKIFKNRGVRESWLVLFSANIFLIILYFIIIILYNPNKAIWFYLISTAFFISYVVATIILWKNFMQKEDKRIDARKFPKILKEISPEE